MSRARFIRTMIVAALMLTALTLSVVATPRDRLSETRASFVLEQEVPMQFGDWRYDSTSVPLPPSPDQQTLLTQIYDQILSRTYVNSKGERMMLSITYGSRQNQQMRAHRQEVCYSAQGFKISDLVREPITVSGNSVSATHLVATQTSRVEPVTYWFTMGDQVVLTHWEREVAQFKYALSGYIPDGYLFRVSNLSADPKLAFQRHIAFADELLANIKPELRARLIGSAIQ